MANETVRTWLDRLEVILESEAELAGLLGHGTMIGDAREFFASRVLKTLLPPGVHIGTGKVIDGEGGVSRQIDIVVYDSRFPYLGTEGGGGLYFVEGVLATIEVKSRITRESLIQSLDNCLSVMRLSPHAESREPMDDFAAMLRKEQGLSIRDSVDMTRGVHVPKTYVFGYGTDLSCKTTCEVIDGWFHENEEPLTSHNVHLPRVIATGNTIAISSDGWFRIQLDEATQAHFLETFGQSSRVVMGIWSTSARFGWLALHLMGTVSTQIGLINHTSGVRYSIREYLPVDAYHRDLEKRECYYIAWTGRFAK